MNSNDQVHAAISCKNLTKSYQEGPQPVDVLKNINFEVAKGERTAIMGSSGSGKSTLLNLLGGLDTPDSGQVLVAGENIAALSNQRRGELRNRQLGFVYQFHHLLPEFTAMENVAMPLLIRGTATDEVRKQATEILDQVGLSDRLEHKPAELSGGERQRVAIARALVARPQCLLLDEPTGNLDRQTAQEIHALLLELNERYNSSLIVVTHDIHLAATMQNVYRLTDGELTAADASSPA